MKNYEKPKDELATTRRNKTHLHSEVIMIMHTTHLNLKLESFKNPPDFSNQLLSDNWHLFPLIFLLSNGTTVSKITTDIPIGNPDSCGIPSDPEGR